MELEKQNQVSCVCKQEEEFLPHDVKREVLAGCQVAQKIPDFYMNELDNIISETADNYCAINEISIVNKSLTNQYSRNYGFLLSHLELINKLNQYYIQWESSSLTDVKMANQVKRDLRRLYKCFMHGLFPNHFQLSNANMNLLKSKMRLSMFLHDLGRKIYI